MNKKLLILLCAAALPLLAISQPVSKVTSAVKYNAAVQEKYFPEPLKGIFLGMTYDQLKKIYSVESLDYESNFIDSFASVTMHFPVGNSVDELESAAFYFAMSDTTYNAASIPGNSRLFRIVLEFAYQDARVFVQRYKQNKSIKGKMTDKGWKWTFKTPDGVDWMITYDEGFYVIITGNIKGTPWMKTVD